MKIGKSADKNWEYLVGVYLGDGCVTNQNDARGKPRPYFRLNTIDQDFALTVKAVLHHFTEYAVTYGCHPVPKSKKPNHNLQCGDSELCVRLKAETDSKKKLPDWIWTCDHEARLAFIAGLMDSEGYCCINSSGSLNIGYCSCDVWFDDFIRVLNKAGIEVGKIGTVMRYKAHHKTPRRFTIKNRPWVLSGAYFTIQRKQRRVDEWAKRSQLISETNTPTAA